MVWILSFLSPKIQSLGLLAVVIHDIVLKGKSLGARDVTGYPVQLKPGGDLHGVGEGRMFCRSR